jgi:hypothetical protein
MIYLIGVDHVFQHDGRVIRGTKELVLGYRNEFYNFILDAAREYFVTMITEEWCDPEHNQLVGATTTIGKLAAENLAIKHCYIEPCGEIREQLGLPTTRYDHLPDNELRRIYDIREEYWLKELQSFNAAVTLHICGADHIQSFGSLLSRRDLRFITLQECWGAQYLSCNHKYNKNGIQ